MLSNKWFGRRRFLKVFLHWLPLWLPWQPEFFMEYNYLNEFERGPPRNTPVNLVEIQSIVSQEKSF